MRGLHSGGKVSPTNPIVADDIVRREPIDGYAGAEGSEDGPLWRQHPDIVVSHYGALYRPRGTFRHSRP